MAAGPWFTVREEGEGWQMLDEIWISNGPTYGLARLEYKSELLPAKHQTEAL